MARLPLPILLSFNGGYVDTVGFVALAGLFTAHVTGNFVTLGASIALGTGGALSKLLALPVFCIVILLVRLLSQRLERSRKPVMTVLLWLKLVLFIIAATFAQIHGPFDDGNSLAAFAIGMVLVSAMAIQNAFHRVHLSKMPPTTLMTGTTTQIMLDLADLIGGTAQGDLKPVKERLKRMSASVVAFALGCAAAAVAFLLSRTWCFAVPVVLVALSFFAPVGSPETASVAAPTNGVHTE
ncbi:DUF1275 family protein [Mesorhizobium sp. B2-4-17]|uniref:YoaK family protein n=1 Tax=Mesorhizobium sp. B2-4-17 TaxID=2589932 RepID=UPI00112796CB|nr:DUF1275 family protein [Mesorhizobium sp. B2-4-17]TPK78123.1 DUF1275 domain-containing protein [Mesorhizobium sp. B2-4-17]